MEETTLDTLEYQFVLDELSTYCSTPYGREVVLDLRPSIDIDEIRGSFRRLAEIVSLKNAGFTLPIGRLADVRPYISKAVTRGTYLSGLEMVGIRDLLATVIELRELEGDDLVKRYPALMSTLGLLSDQSHLYKELKRVFDDNAEIADRASPALYAIRRELRGARARAMKILDRLRGTEKFTGYFQEDFFTIRDDRYALAIKAGFQSRFPGVIHGRSASGETYFIEPMELVELNNRQAILKRDEKTEEITILKYLTTLLAGQKTQIEADIKVIEGLDFLKARCEFSEALSLEIPVLVSETQSCLKGARHPLLVLKGLRGELDVKPVDIRIGGDVKVLVISGANTGGKTVALKTLGLITLLAQSAIPVPVLPGSEVRVFAQIFADIGDRQGIEESLSTFSAHIVRLKSFLESSQADSLVLIDEIGVGTDPSEGAVFALSVLEELKDIGATVAVTTHINLLKAHAECDPAFENASVIFDDNSMLPSYNLSYGTPGASLGLKIASSLGMPATLITRARERLGRDEGAFIDSLNNLDREKKRLRRLNDRNEILLHKRQSAVERLRSDRAKILDKVKVKANKLSSEAREEVDSIIRKFRQGLKDEAFSKKQLQEKKTSVMGVIESTTAKIYPASRVKEKAYYPERGDVASITGTNTRGTVISVNTQDKEVELQIGRMKVKTPWTKLKKSASAPKGKERTLRAAYQSAGSATALPDVELSLKVIGMRVDEALKAVEAFIDGAHVNATACVEIIHGLGTGALRSAIRERLAENALVKSVKDGDVRHGGAGVTVVELC